MPKRPQVETIPRRVLKRPKDAQVVSEQEYWANLRGREVELHLLDGSKIRGKLVWFEAYTIGIEQRGDTDPWAVWKHGIMRLRAIAS